MTKQIFEQISEGLREALAVGRNEAKPYKLHVPAEIDVHASTSRKPADLQLPPGSGVNQLKQF